MLSDNASGTVRTLSVPLHDAKGRAARALETPEEQIAVDKTERLACTATPI
jgi:hypothetical protein